MLVAVALVGQQVALDICWCKSCLASRAHIGLLLIMLASSIIIRCPSIFVSFLEGSIRPYRASVRAKYWVGRVTDEWLRDAVFASGGVNWEQHVVYQLEAGSVGGIALCLFLVACVLAHCSDSTEGCRFSARVGLSPSAAVWTSMVAMMDAGRGDLFLAPTQADVEAGANGQVNAKAIRHANGDATPMPKGFLVGLGFVRLCPCGCTLPQNVAPMVLAL